MNAILPRRIDKAPKRSSRWRSEELRTLLAYDAEQGKLFWKERPRGMFSDDRQFNTWNTRFAGKEALTTAHSAGYRVGSINGRIAFAHRVIWAIIHNDDELDGEIDHINGDRSDNRLSNLRLVSRQENRLNVKAQHNCPHGVPGIRQSGKRWSAHIQHDGWQRHLGTFDTFADAVLARRQAEVALGFHPNHGRHNAAS